MAETRQFISRSKAESPFFAGIDLGGTNIKIGVVDNQGRPLSFLTIPTEIKKGAECGAQRMGAAVLQAVRNAGLEPNDIARVGLGSPGGMDIPAGMILSSINLTGWKDFPIRDRVGHHCGLPVTFENDANAAAYGEFWVGSGRNYDSMALLTLGTGIGCGIIIGETVIQGAHSYGGEVGHILIDPDNRARLCGCGKRGHLEAYCGALAVVKRAQEALDAGQVSSLSKQLAAGEKLTPKLIAQAAERGDDFAKEIIGETARYLGLGIVNLIHTVDPAVVLLGGAMTFGGRDSELGRWFLAQVKNTAVALAIGPLPQKIAIDFAILGSDAGYIGAAGVARLDYRKIRP
jgi:glucokinase